MLCLCNKRLLGRPLLWLLSHSYVPKLSVKDAVCSNEIYVLNVSKGHMKRAWSLRQSYWVVAEHLGDRPCGGLVEIGPSRLLGLNAWSLVSGTILEGLAGMALLREVCHCGWPWSFKRPWQAQLVLSACFCAMPVFLLPYSSRDDHVPTSSPHRTLL